MTNKHQWIIVRPNWGGEPYRLEYATRELMRHCRAAMRIRIREADVYTTYAHGERVTVHEFIELMH